MSKKIVFIAGLIVSLIFGYSLINQISGGLKAGDRLSGATGELYSLQIKNRELKEKLKEVNSYQFIEQQARDKLGLTREGETLIIIPDNKLQQVLGEAKKGEQARLPNWQGWLKVFWQ